MNQNFDFNPNPNDYQPINLEKKDNGRAFSIASLVLGICAIIFGCICCCCYYIAAVVGILAIVFAFVAKKRNNGKMSGMAIAGLVCGIIGLIGFIVMLVLSIGTSGGTPQTQEELIQMIEQFYRDYLGIDIDIDEIIRQSQEAQ